jgi:hypothetical protein
MTHKNLEYFSILADSLCDDDARLTTAYVLVLFFEDVSQTEALDVSAKDVSDLAESVFKIIDTLPQLSGVQEAWFIKELVMRLIPWLAYDCRTAALPFTETTLRVTRHWLPRSWTGPKGTQYSFPYSSSASTQLTISSTSGSTAAPQTWTLWKPSTGQ